MILHKKIKWLSTMALSMLLVGCASPALDKDYSAFQASNPKSILILPPINESPDMKASNSVYSHASLPVGESGYYVFPVGVVQETFASNGLTQPEDIQNISLNKLNEFFHPDAILYLSITDYGASYQVISSTSKVTLKGRLIDAKTGQQIWDGSASAIEQSDTSGGLLGSLVNALVKQIADNASNRSHQLSPIATYNLLSAKHKNGLLYGPYSPKQGLVSP